MKKITLLLTGAIEPNSWDLLKLTDSEERKKQYIEAIRYYLEYTDYDLLFVENSGNDLKHFFKEYKERTEFLTYISEPTIPDRGKGYKEMEILNYAFANSNLLVNSDFIVKITGRLKITNINSLLKIDLSNDKIMLLANIYKLGKMDSRFFLFHKKFWFFLKKSGSKIDIKFSFEKALWVAARKFDKVNSNYIFKQFNQALKVRGYSGGFNKSYYRGWGVEIIKQVNHKVFYFNKMKMFKNDI